MPDMYHQPWKLEPNKIRGAGGREIDKLRGVYPPRDDPAGSEAWIGSVTRVGNPPPGEPHRGCSEVTLPDGRRMYLFEAINLAPEEVLGPRHLARHGKDTLGMLIKYLDAQKQYILQAHPTRPWAKKMWDSDFGKEESWYVIGTRDDTAEPAYILLGFKEGVTREKFEELYRRDDLPALEKLCHKIRVRPGETYFVGGGVPHALGEGCFVIEVQEPSDITVVPITPKKRYEAMKAMVGNDPRLKMEDEKLYDERMLGAFIYDGCDEAENLRRWRIPPRLIREGDWGAEHYIISPRETSFFSYTRLDLNGPVPGPAPLRDTGFPQAAIVLEGEGRLRWDGGGLSIRRGDELFLPCLIPGAEFSGPGLSVILCHPEGANQERQE
ncbi:MAG: class I mannose-6-phosphate isomerase [Treponema sp.]|jgi:mannose-6-phosphate isomerase|nr:class I mannose-6-phosphate isomerase [Treponema sp.]